MPCSCRFGNIVPTSEWFVRYVVRYSSLVSLVLFCDFVPVMHFRLVRVTGLFVKCVRGVYVVCSGILFRQLRVVFVTLFDTVRSFVRSMLFDSIIVCSVRDLCP